MPTSAADSHLEAMCEACGKACKCMEFVFVSEQKREKQVKTGEKC